MSTPAISATGRLPGDPASATRKLMDLLGSLCRARQRQLLVALGARALLAGIVLAALAVLAVRLGGLALAPLVAVGASVLAALVVGAFVAWRRWPDAMTVAISADLVLNLSQQLSTAYELRCAGERPQLVERLAQQAFGPRPETVRYRQVFPARVGNAGVLVPVALLALVLIATVDLPVAEPPAVFATAPDVRAAGRRLHEFGRDMHSRARAGGLDRSQQASRHVQTLGANMADGRLDRAQALMRLRSLNGELGDAQRSLVPEGKANMLAALGDAPGRTVTATSLAEPLDAHSRGDQPTTGLRADDIAGSGLERGGLTRAELQAALDQANSGDRAALGDAARRLTEGDLALRDARSLGEARAALDRARRELGDANASGSDAQGEEAARTEAFDAAAMDLPGEDAGDGGDHGGMAGGRGLTGSGADASDASEGKSVGGGRAVLRPRALPGGDGPLRRGTMRALPRLNAYSAAPTPLALEPAAGQEAALARESYPPRYKALIRRYFIGRASGEHEQAGEPAAASQAPGEPPSRP